MLRCRAKSDYDTLTTLRAYLNKNSRTEYDLNFENCFQIKNIGCNLFEAIQITKSQFGVIKSRDFYQYIWYNIEKDGSINLIGVDIADRAESKDIIRMKVPIVGVRFEPDP